MKIKLPQPKCSCGCDRKAIVMGYAKECLDKKAAAGHFNEALIRATERDKKVRERRRI